MAKKKFDIGYSMVVRCKVTVEAETKEEAEEMFCNGDVATSLDNDIMDSECEDIDYIIEVEDD